MKYQPPQEYRPNQPNIPEKPAYPPPPPPAYSPPPDFAYPRPYAEGRPPSSAYPPPPMPTSMQPMANGASQPAPQPAQVGQGDGMAVAGLVLGFISIPMVGLAFCGLIFGLLGLIFSLQGRASVRNHTWAVVGIVLSSVGLAVSILHGFGFWMFNLP